MKSVKNYRVFQVEAGQTRASVREFSDYAAAMRACVIPESHGKSFRYLQNGKVEVLDDRYQVRYVIETPRRPLEESGPPNKQA